MLQAKKVMLYTQIPVPAGMRIRVVKFYDAMYLENVLGASIFVANHEEYANMKSAPHPRLAASAQEC